MFYYGRYHMGGLMGMAQFAPYAGVVKQSLEPEDVVALHMMGEIVSEFKGQGYTVEVKPLHRVVIRWKDVSKEDDPLRSQIFEKASTGMVPLRLVPHWSPYAVAWYVTDEKVYSVVGPAVVEGEDVWVRMVQCVDIKSGRLEWTWFQVVPEGFRDYYGPFCVTGTGQIILPRHRGELGVHDKTKGLQGVIRFEGYDADDEGGEAGKVPVVTLEDISHWGPDGIMCMKDGSLKMWDAHVMIRFKLDGTVLAKLETKDNENQAIIGVGEVFAVVQDKAAGGVALWDDGGRELCYTRTPVTEYDRAIVVSGGCIALQRVTEGACVHLLHVVKEEQMRQYYMEAGGEVNISDER